jgi:hypothetical protein
VICDAEYYPPATEDQEYVVNEKHGAACFLTDVNVGYLVVTVVVSVVVVLVKPVAYFLFANAAEHLGKVVVPEEVEFVKFYAAYYRVAVNVVEYPAETYAESVVVELVKYDVETYHLLYLANVVLEVVELVKPDASYLEVAFAELEVVE